MDEYQGYVQKCQKKLVFLLERLPPTKASGAKTSPDVVRARWRIKKFVEKVNSPMMSLLVVGSGKMVSVIIPRDISLSHMDIPVCTFYFTEKGQDPKDLSDVEIGKILYEGLVNLAEIR